MEITIENCVEKYLHYSRVMDQSALVKTYGTHLRDWMRWLDSGGIGDGISRNSSMNDVNSIEAVSSFYKHLSSRRRKDGKKFNRNTIRIHQHALRGLWIFACDQVKWSPERCPLLINQCAKVPMAKAQDKWHYDASDAEMEAMVASVQQIKDVYEKAMVDALMNVFLIAGVRRKELIQLEVWNYNPKEHTMFIEDTKNGVPRTQRLTPTCCSIIDHYLQKRKYVPGTWVQDARKAWCHQPNPDAKDYLFVSSERRHVGDRGMTMIFRRLRDIAGLPKEARITPHTIRHFQATKIYENFGIRAAQKFCGHKSEKTTWAYIRKTSDEKMEEVLAAVEIGPGRSHRIPMSPSLTDVPPAKQRQNSTWRRRVELRR